MTQVKLCPFSLLFPFVRYFLTIVTIQGDTGKDYFRSLFHLKAKLGKFLIHSRTQRNFSSKTETSSLIWHVSSLPVTFGEKRLVQRRAVFKKRGVRDLSRDAQGAYRGRNNFDSIQMVSQAVTSGD
ncbi:hypothetical protein TNCV_3872891 [Trichonephila clavipes]|nr:hypothetical protein TNCV_3872891 [Trichonephila clavipes]